MSKGQIMAPSFRFISEKAQSDARRTNEGAAQVASIDAKLDAFVGNMAGRSSGSFASSIPIFNSLKSDGMKLLRQAFDDFALGEGNFAKLTDMYDEESRI
jgi:hypothetical protein